jgi:hypothetical protein
LLTSARAIARLPEDAISVVRAMPEWQAEVDAAHTIEFKSRVELARNVSSARRSTEPRPARFYGNGRGADKILPDHVAPPKLDPVSGLLLLPRTDPLHGNFTSGQYSEANVVGAYHHRCKRTTPCA